MERTGAVVVMGGGPSLTQADADYCRGRARVIVVKEAAQRAPWADALYFADPGWFEIPQARALIDAFKGRLVTIQASLGVTGPEKERLRKLLPRLEVYRHDGDEGLCHAPDGLRTGHNSGYQAVNLAFHMGARRIVLLGIDLKRSVEGKTHFYERQRHCAFDLYEKLFIPAFATLVAPLAAAGVEIVNASPDSALECFPKMPLAEALCLP